MFPNNVSFLARERDRERYQEAEHIRLVKIAKLQQADSDRMLRRLANWLGSQMIKLGAKLQRRSVTPLPQTAVMETTP